MYEGIIVEESLIDSRLLNSISIQSVKIINAEKLAERWHIYKVLVDEDQLCRLSKELKHEKWYMHFWNKDTMVAIFPDKTFTFKFSDGSSRNDAIEHGMSLGIPREQLDFLIE